MDGVISKAQFAREVNRTRARVSQWCARGLPVTPDGRIVRKEALAWIEANIDSSRGGWWGNLRPRKSDSQRTQTRAVSMASSCPPYEDNRRVISVHDREIREKAVIDFVNDARQTEHIESFARMALRFGCSMQQAFAVARWFDMFLAFYFIPRDPERQYIRVYDEPDWRRFAADAGTKEDVEAWQAWMNRLLEEVVPGKPEG
jgi:lauroyl/myristoyl acyltransferase